MVKAAVNLFSHGADFKVSAPKQTHMVRGLQGQGVQTPTLVNPEMILLVLFLG